MAESADILRAAQPSFISSPNRNAGGLTRPENVRGFGPFTAVPIDQRSHYQAPFPEVEETTTTEQAVVPDNIYSFKMIDASDSEGSKVLIHDGEVSANGSDGILPSGMGNDDFILAIAADGDDVWVLVTYDSATLAITSASIASGTGIPDSTLGNAYLLLGYVNIAKGKVSPHNTQCGDINIAFMRGAVNGAPALFLLSQIDGPQPLDTP